MSLDDRMRDSLPRISETPGLDVESHLERTLGQAAPARAGFPFGLVLAGMTTVIVVVLGLPAIGGLIGPGADPSPTTVPATAAPTPDIADAYATTLAVDVPDPTGLGLAGSWTLTMGSDLTLDVTPPPEFTGSQASGHAYSIDGDTFETDLWFNDMCDSLGRYRWSRDGANLTFVVIDDPCETRRIVLATETWVSER